MAVSQWVQDAFGHLHLFSCASPEHWGVRGTVVKQMDCMACVEREMRTVLSGFVADAQIKAIDATHLADAKLVCERCNRLGKPTLLPGGKWFHSDSGYQECPVGPIWDQIAREEG